MNNTIVVGMGEALWDMLPEGKKIGGAPANFAYHVSQFGLDSRVVSAVGEDELGAEILKNFREKKLNCMIETVPYPTGTVQVELDINGVPCYDIREGVAWDNIPFTPALEGLARQTRAVCFGSLPYASARWHSAAWFPARPSTASSTRCPAAKTGTKYSTSTCAKDSIRRKSSATRCASATS